jgi:hypothetical protein
MPPQILRGAGSLRSQFGVVPVSIIDCNDKDHQNMKQAWLDMGIDSGAGRDADLLGPGLRKLNAPGSSLTGTSVFCPHVASVLQRWYAPVPSRTGPPVVIGDPFAGGSVRGITASKNGYFYVGVELSVRQVVENRRQAAKICGDCLHQPVWIIGDGEKFIPLLRSAFIDKGLPADTKLDMILTCPPYAPASTRTYACSTHVSKDVARRSAIYTADGGHCLAGTSTSKSTIRARATSRCSAPTTSSSPSTPR